MTTKTKTTKDLEIGDRYLDNNELVKIIRIIKAKPFYKVFLSNGKVIRSMPTDEWIIVNSL